MSVRAHAGVGLASLATLLLLGVAGCGPQAGAQQGPPPAPTVGVVEIVAGPHEQTVRLSGRISAYQMSEVRPQIGGIVRARHFTEGSTVRAGQTLYEIDPGPARAELSSAESAAASARSRLDRYQELIAIGAVSQQELDDARAAADQAASALATARIGVGYTRVTAPITGIIGVSSVTPGALAVPSQPEPFAVIQQIDRVYIDMTQSSAEMMRIRQQLERQGRNQARVRLTLPDGTEYAQDGVLQVSEVTVNESTGTVRLRALFPNERHVLLPGMFVQAELSIGVDQDAILAPQRGVSRNARGEAVALVLNPQGVVEERIIETGGTSGDQWVVLSGLNAGDRVIVEGTQLVQPGAQAVAAPVTAPPTQEGRLDLRGRQG